MTEPYDQTTCGWKAFVEFCTHPRCQTTGGCANVCSSEAIAEAQRLADKYCTDWMPVYEACSWPGCVSNLGCSGQCGKRIEPEVVQ